jgi:hypothetical protein
LQGGLENYFSGATDSERFLQRNAVRIRAEKEKRAKENAFCPLSSTTKTERNRYALQKESDDFFFAQDVSSANEYDWSFNWDNTITGLDTNTFIAPSNGWFSIDKILSSTLTITINNKQNSTIKETMLFR